LLVASAASFAVAERLKLEKPPVTAVILDRVFSPVCDCPSRVARLRVRLQRADRIAVTVLAVGDSPVRTLVRDRRLGRGRHELTWNGRDDAGSVVRDGDYRVRIRAAGAGASVVLPFAVRVDTAPPRVRVLSLRVGPRVATVRYRASERAHGLVLAGAGRRVRGRWQRPLGTLRFPRAWLAAGPVALSAEDLAGNVSARVPLDAGVR
jgi:hypothetical protein